MGSFFEKIRNRPIKVDTELLNASGSKLRQYFCSFRSICQDFTIRTGQYMQIFTFNVKSFQVWDPQRTGIIDAMQMFSGLIIFSKVSFQDKIRFLYEIFDLNQQGYLEYDELAYLFMNVCEATCKIYQVESAGLNDQIIEQYLDQFFSEETELRYEDFLRWSYRTLEIKQFFQIIGHPFKPQKNSHSIDLYDETNLQSKRITHGSPFNYRKQSRFKIKIDQAFLNMIKNYHILHQEQNSTGGGSGGEQVQQEFNPVMKWIYGIRIDDIRYPLHYRKTQCYKAANQKFIYICGKNVIVLYPKLSLQKNYTNHRQPVSCVQLTSCDTIVASGEMGLFPTIHIWELKTTKCIQKLDRIHKNSIKLMKFLRGNELLVTIGQKFNSPLVIVNIKTKEKVLSTYLIEPIANIVEHSSENNLTEFYMVLPSHIVKCTSKNNVSYELTYNKINFNQKTTIATTATTTAANTNNNAKSRIKIGVSIKINERQMIALCDQNNHLTIYDPINNETHSIELSPPGSSPEQANPSLQDEPYKILDLIPSGHRNTLYLLHPKSFTVLQFDPKFSIIHKNIVNGIPTGYFNLELVQLLEVAHDCVILVSLMGDVIKVSNFGDWGHVSGKGSQGNGEMEDLMIEQDEFYGDQGETEIQQYESIKIISEDVEQFQEQSQNQQQQQQKFRPIRSQRPKLKIHKYCQIFKLQKITGICFLSPQPLHQTPSSHSYSHCHSSPQHPQKLVIASNAFIYMIDQVEKQLLSLQCLEHNITHIHSVGNTYAVATELKYIMILRDGVTVEKSKCLDSPGGNSCGGGGSPINGFKITNDNLIVATQQEIYVYFKSGGNYLSNSNNNQQVKKIKVEHGIPIHISMTSLPKVFIVITKQKTILRLNTQAKQKHVTSARELNCDFLQTYYPQITTKTPILFSGTKKIFLVAQPNGDINYWNSLTHMTKNQESFSLLTGHSSQISELVFTNTGFISSGAEDGQVIIWQNCEVVVEGDGEGQGEREGEREGQGQRKEEEGVEMDKTRNRVKFPEDSVSQIGGKVKDMGMTMKFMSQCFMDQIVTLEKFSCDRLPLKDSQIEVIVKDGDLYKDISKNINHIIVPNNTEVFEPLAAERKKKMMATTEQRQKKTRVTKLQEKLSLNINNCFIYGFNSQKTRQSLFYIHHYHQKKQKPKNNFPKIQQTSQKTKQIEFAHELLLPINETHNDCKRSFLYFTGRLAVIWSPVLKTQYQYDFHSNRITSAAAHPSKNLVCTAEISNTFPVVHVWSVDSITLIHNFKTRHNRFISKLEFSRDGDFIVSLGGPPFQQSIEIYNWVREELICFRYLEDACLYDVKFNPYDYNEIAACGLRSLFIMKVSNRTLIKKQQAIIKTNEEITCMAYTSSIYGNSIESDLLTGSSLGTISLFICGKYVTCKKNAHEKSINCLKLCQLFKYKTIVISAGQDNMIRFWDTKFNQVTSINVKEVVNVHKFMGDASKQGLGSAPQSVDVYQCFGNRAQKGEIEGRRGEQMDTETILLVGTRNGSIFQVKINNQYQGLKLFVSQNTAQEKKLNNLINFMLPPTKTSEKPQIHQKKIDVAQKLQLNYINHFNSLPSTFNRSSIFDIKGNFMITYTRASQFFTLWNIEKRQMIKLQKLNGYPSIIKFSKTNFVGVGYLDGRIEFLQYDNSSQFSIREQKIFLDWDYQPINMVFSDNDSKIAITFLKEHQQKRLSNNNNNTNIGLMQENSSSEGEQILMIYERVFTPGQNQFIRNQKNTHCISTEKRKFKNIFWCDFNTGGSKLLICYTLSHYLKLSNQNRKRMMSSLQSTNNLPLYEYILYDVVRRMEKQLANQEFNVLNFSPAVRAKYCYYGECRVAEDVMVMGKGDEDGLGGDEGKRKFGAGGQETGAKKTVNGSSSNGGEHVPVPGPTTTVPTVTSLGNQITEQFVPICQMTQFEKLTLMGTIYGQVFAISSQNFYTDTSQQNSDCQKKCVKVKCFALFDSPINNMQVVGNRLFISAKDCGTIAEYTLSVDDQGEVLGLCGGGEQEGKLEGGKGETLGEVYYETFTVEKVENWTKYVFPKRKNFYEMQISNQDKKTCKNSAMQMSKCSQKDEIILQPYRIFGRNALYKRNNVLIDLKQNLITFSGCNLLIMSAIPAGSNNNSDFSQSPSRFQQEFLKLDNSVFTVNPQISTITLSEDKRTLFAGTTEQTCQIIIWDISTRTQLQHISFKGYISVLLIKVSEKQRHAVVLVLNKQAQQVIYFISLVTFETLASFCLSSEIYICDFTFVPGNQYKFLACGVNYMVEWTFKSGILNFRNFNMKKSQQLVGGTSKTASVSSLTFYSIIFLKDIAITGGSDGYLYLWNDYTLIKKQNANPKAAILTLFASKNSKIFASGAVDGKANIWQLGSSSIIQKVYEFSIYSGKETIIPSKYHIQSVSIGTNEIFIGTRSGQIHRCEFSSSNESAQSEQNNYNNSKQNHCLILSAFDNDRINSCSFNISSQKLYLLTQSGLFSVFNLATNQKIKEEKIKIDGDQIVKMLACKLSSKIYIILKKGIDVYTYVEQGKHSNRFSKEKQNLRLKTSQIKAAILSLNQKYLAILITPQVQNAHIKIYSMTRYDGRQFEQEPFKKIDNVPSDVKIIDFSTDNGYLIFKGEGQDTIYDLTTKQPINTNQIQFEIQWNEQAKKSSRFIRDICSTYSEQNKLKSIIQIMNHSVIATDQMGSLRVFKYGQNFQDNTIEYYHIYLEHLNNVYICMISSDCTVLVTVGWWDRSIVLWRVRNFQVEGFKGKENGKPKTKEKEKGKMDAIQNRS